MNKPHKILSNLDLSNNKILNVSQIKGPSYDESKNKLPRKLDIYVDSSSVEKSKLDLHTDKLGTIKIFTGEPDTVDHPAKNKIELISSGVLDKGIRNDTHDDYTLQVSSILKGSIGNATNLKTDSTGATSITSKNLIANLENVTGNISTKHSRAVAEESIKSHKIFYGLGNSNTSISKLPEIEAMPVVAQNPETTVDSLNLIPKNYNLFIASDNTQSLVNLDYIVVDSNLFVEDRLNFTNTNKNIIKAKQKIDIYTPDFELRTKSTDTVFLTSIGSKTNIVTDTETVTTKVISQKEALLEGKTSIQGNLLEVSTSTVNVGYKNSLPSEVIMSRKLSSDTLEVSKEKRDTLNGKYTLAVARNEASQSSTRDIITNSQDAQGKYRTTFVTDNLSIPETFGTVNTKGKVELDVTGSKNKFDLKATKVNLELKDNSFKISQGTASSEEFIVESLSGVSSKVMLGNHTYGSDEGVYLEHTSNVAQISTKDASFKNLVIRASGKLDTSSDVNSTANLNFITTGEQTIDSKGTLKINATTKLAKSSTTIDENASTQYDLTVAKKKILTASSSSSVFNVTNATIATKLTSEKETTLQTKTDISGTTTIDATGKSFKLDAANVDLTVNDNSLSLTQAGFASSKNLDINSSRTDDSNGSSYIHMGNPVYDSNDGVVIEFAKGLDPKSRVSAKDASFDSLKVKAGGLITSSDITANNDLVFKDGEDAAVRKIKGQNNLEIDVKQGTLTTGASTYNLTAPATSVTADTSYILTAGAAEILNAVSGKSTLNVTDATASTKLTSSKATDLIGTTEIKNGTLSVSTTTAEITSATSIAVGTNNTGKVDLKAKEIAETAVTSANYSAPETTLDGTKSLHIKAGGRSTEVLTGNSSSVTLNATQVNTTNVTATGHVSSATSKVSNDLQIGSIKLHWDNSTNSLSAIMV